jgi:hypothetical protein
MATLGQVHAVFTRRLGELTAHARANAAASRGAGVRVWDRPEDWSGDPDDVPGLAAAYDRSEIDQNYAQLIADGSAPGTTGDAVAVKTQADYVALQERAIRRRYASSVRCIAHAMSRMKGHGSEKGIFSDGVARYVHDCIKAGGE